MTDGRLVLDRVLNVDTATTATLWTLASSNLSGSEAQEQCHMRTV